MKIFFNIKNLKTNYLIMVIILLFTGIYFTTCENKILKSWWDENEPAEEDFDYVTIIKDVPILIYETIVEEIKIYETVYETIKEIVVESYPEYIYIPGETIYIDKPLPPEVLLQYINILEIQYIIFAGESVEFNGPPGEFASTALTNQEKRNNSSIVEYFTEELGKKDDYFTILHGHANMITGTAEEAADLEDLSISRAVAVQKAIYDEYKEREFGDPDIDLDKRVTTKGYGGGKSVSGSLSSYAGLNRRVEAILFTVEVEEVKPDKGR